MNILFIFRLKVVSIYRLVYYNGNEYWSFLPVCNCDRANHLDKDLLGREMTCRWFKSWQEEVDEAEAHVKKTA